MSKRKPIKKYGTPPGIARYPWLTKADDKYDESGQYKVDLLLDPDGDHGPEVAKFLEWLDELAAQAEASAKEEHDGLEVTLLEPYFEDIDDQKKPTGKVVIKSSAKASGKNEDGTVWKRKLAIFDAKGKEITGGVSVGGGSTIRLSVAPKLWAMKKAEGRGRSKKEYVECGVKLYLYGVKVLELAEFGGASADALGFGGEEEGFVAEDNYDASDFQGGSADDSDGDF